MGEKVYKIKFNFKPHAIQQEILDHLDGKVRNPDGDEYRFFVAILGRQTGKSWLGKYVLIDWANNRSKKCVWIAPTIKTARTHWNNIKNLIEQSGLPVKKISETAKEIHFFGGGRITIGSAIEPDNLRGDSLDLIILDEAAFFRNGHYVWYDVCFPMLSATRGKAIILTTPNGMNWVYDLFQMGKDPKSKYFKSWQATYRVSPYQDVKTMEDLRRKIPERTWRQEYEAEFLTDTGGVFAGVYNASIIPISDTPEPYGNYVAGIDFGFADDYTTFTVLHTNPADGVVRQVYGERWNNEGSIATIQRLLKLIERWRPTTVYLERNGVGDTMLRLIKDIVGGADVELRQMMENGLNPDQSEFGINTKTLTVYDTKIVGIHMQNDVKRMLVESLSAAIEFGRLKILDRDSDYGYTQLAEISTYVRETTQSGMYVTYNAAVGCHDDTISALYLAYRGIPKPVKVRMAIDNTYPEKQKANPFRGGGKSLRRRKYA